jgi:hypothetical protein
MISENHRIACFYATQLLRVAGYLAIDDVIFNAVRRVVDFFLNYPCYELFRSLGRVKSRSWKRVVARPVLSLISPRMLAELFPGRVYRWIFEDTWQQMGSVRAYVQNQLDW